MKGKFKSYLLWPFGEKLIFTITAWLLFTTLQYVHICKSLVAQVCVSRGLTVVSTKFNKWYFTLTYIFDWQHGQNQLTQQFLRCISDVGFFLLAVPFLLENVKDWILKDVWTQILMFLTLIRILISCQPRLKKSIKKTMYLVSVATGVRGI